MLEIVKMIKSDSEVSIAKLDGFTDDYKEKLFVAQKTLKDILRPALIFHNWTVAYAFFCENIARLLNGKTEIRTDFVLYQLKIILNAGLEFSDTIKRYMIHRYPEPEEKQNPQNKKFETHSKGEWIFKEFSARVYDENFSYRLCYNLRNCMQHVGPEGISLERNEYGNKIILNKKDYINGHYGIQERFKRELFALPDEKIDLIATIKSYDQNISELFKELEEIYRCENLRDELYSSLVITEKLPCEENDLIRFAILSKDVATSEMDTLNCKIDYIQVKKAFEFVEMHCKYFILQGEYAHNEISDQCPYQITKSTYFPGSYRFTASGMSYVKIDEKKFNNKYYVIYSLECLFPEERLAIQDAVRGFLFK